MSPVIHTPEPYDIDMYQMSLMICTTEHYNIDSYQMNKSIWIKKVWWALDLPQTSRANPAQCYSTHQEKRDIHTRGLYDVDMYPLRTGICSMCLRYGCWCVRRHCHRTYKWWMSHGTHMNGSLHTYKWVMAHIWMSHGIHINESRLTYEWVMAHIWMGHDTHMNESRHAYDWVITHIYVHVYTYMWRMYRHMEHFLKSWQLMREERLLFPRLCPRLYL